MKKPTAIVLTGLAALALTGCLSPPTGYTTSELVFDDTFSGTALNMSNWTDCGAYGNGGPQSCGETFSASHSTWFGTNLVSVDNGLTLGLENNPAQVNPSTVDEQEGSYIISKASYSGTFYVQVRAKMEDMTQGQWPAIWMVPTNAGDPPEVDNYEGGFNCNETGCPAGTSPNDNYAPNYHEPNGSQPLIYAPGAMPFDTDLTGWNTYGMEYDYSAQTVKFYLNGALEAEQQGAVPNDTWELIIWNAGAGYGYGNTNGGACGYHTCLPGSEVASGDNPMQVSEVQVYQP